MTRCGTGLSVISPGASTESHLKASSSEQTPFWPRWGLWAAQPPTFPRETACPHPARRKPYQGASVPISARWEGEIAFHKRHERSKTIPP